MDLTKFKEEKDLFVLDCTNMCTRILEQISIFRRITEKIPDNIKQYINCVYIGQNTNLLRFSIRKKLTESMWWDLNIEFEETIINPLTFQRTSEKGYNFLLVNNNLVSGNLERYIIDSDKDLIHQINNLFLLSEAFIVHSK